MLQYPCFKSILSSSFLIAGLAVFLACSSDGTSGSETDGDGPGAGKTPCEESWDCDAGSVCRLGFCEPVDEDGDDTPPDGDGIIDGDGVDGDLDTVDPNKGRPEVSAPSSVDFGAVAIGSYAVKQIEIFNIGDEQLTIVSFDLDRATVEHGEFSIVSEPEDGQKVKAGESVIVEVRYDPLDPGTDDELAVLVTNDAGHPIHNIALTSQYKGTPNIVVDPETLAFAHVTAGQTSIPQCIVISNEIDDVGNRVIEITAIDFESRQDNELETHFELIDPPVGSLYVSPSQTVQLCLRFRPLSPGEFNDTLIIENDDPDEEDQVKRVSLSGTGQQIGLIIEPAQAVFPNTLLGTSSETVLAFRRGADYYESLSITGIVFETGEREEAIFALKDPGSLPLVLDDAESHPLDFTFTPQLEGLAEATATLTTEPAIDPPISIQFSGVGGCGSGFLICEDVCVQALTAEHCMGCDPCPLIPAEEPHADIACSYDPDLEDGACGLACDEGWADCDDSYDTGCEHPITNEDFPCCTYVGEDDPYGDGLDQNCDGVDGRLDQVIYVAVGTTGDGTRYSPMGKIQDAIDMADPGWMVWVAIGDYAQEVALKDGVHVIGNFNYPGWDRDTGDEVSRIFRDSPDYHNHNAQIGVTAENISTSTYLDSMTIEVVDNQMEGASNFGLWVKNTDAALHLRDLFVISGMGGPGQDGSDGDPGGHGYAGGQGQPGFEDSDLFNCNDRGGVGPLNGTAGASDCGAAGGLGGDAGWDTNPGGTGYQGSGTTAGGAGGWANACFGFSGDILSLPLDFNIQGLGLPPDLEFCCGCDKCTETNGRDGEDGASGENGNHASPGDTLGEINDDLWMPMAGESGQTGEHGTGGGGGGGGSGGCTACNSWGASGGGGGGAGCGGIGGEGGQGGGGSFGIFLLAASPVIESCYIMTGFGGTGGKGGAGGEAGDGSIGGPVSEYNGTGEQDDGGCGGAGGRGGNGGLGGHGGAGAGGPSFGVYKVDGSEPEFVEMDLLIDIIPEGGGTGGQSPGGNASHGDYGSVGEYIAP